MSMTTSRTGVTGKAMGVLVPQRSVKARQDLPADKVLSLRVGEVGLVSYTDRSGQAHENLVFRFGNKWFWDRKNGERWTTQELEQVNDRMGKELDSRLQSQSAEKATPPLDAVDVMAPSPDSPAVTTGSTYQGPRASST